MRLDRFVGQHNAQGRRSVRLLLAAGRVTVDGRVIRDGRHDVGPFTPVALDGEPLDVPRPAYWMLHKPPGCVSATRDRRHRTVLDWLEPADAEGLHLAGRLDFNSTGLMLLTNDGRWSRRLTDPRHKLPKVYWVRTEEPITAEYVTLFAAGLYFPYEGRVTRPAGLEILAEREARVTLYEGLYHQIKRLFGHFDNRVVALHRERIGPIRLDPSLAPGQYRALGADEIRLPGPAEPDLQEPRRP
ncbi:MAG TPA: pseudouridine synthase [Alcanivorax sp.]|nr:pseudouridine synthase [Alcanivorax sp.]